MSEKSSNRGTITIGFEPNGLLNVFRQGKSGEMVSSPSKTVEFSYQGERLETRWNLLVYPFGSRKEHENKRVIVCLVLEALPHCKAFDVLSMNVRRRLTIEKIGSYHTDLPVYDAKHLRWEFFIDAVKRSQFQRVKLLEAGSQGFDITIEFEIESLKIAPIESLNDASNNRLDNKYWDEKRNEKENASGNGNGNGNGNRSEQQLAILKHLKSLDAKMDKLSSMVLKLVKEKEILKRKELENAIKTVCGDDEDAADGYIDLICNKGCIVDIQSFAQLNSTFLYDLGIYSKQERDKLMQIGHQHLNNEGSTQQ